MSKLPPLPVDLNVLPDREQREEIKPGPIGVRLADYAPKRPRLEESISRVVAEINSVKREPSTIPASIANLEHVSSELGGLLTASAEAMVTEAENLREQTRLWIENLNNEIKAKVEEHALLTERLKEFGQAVLSAHNKYHGDKS
jgi:ElaB/YqjD/DUF883 family membrane-anchored ribosome-binding protein